MSVMAMKLLKEIKFIDGSKTNYLYPTNKPPDWVSSFKLVSQSSDVIKSKLAKKGSKLKPGWP